MASRRDCRENKTAIISKWSIIHVDKYAEVVVEVLVEH